MVSLLFLLTSLTACSTVNSRKLAESNIVKEASKQIDESIAQQQQVRDLMKLPDIPKECGRWVDPKYKPTDSSEILAKKADLGLYKANVINRNCYKLAKKYEEIRHAKPNSSIH